MSHCCPCLSRVTRTLAAESVGGSDPRVSVWSRKTSTTAQSVDTLAAAGHPGRCGDALLLRARDHDIVGEFAVGAEEVAGQAGAAGIEFSLDGVWVIRQDRDGAIAGRPHRLGGDHFITRSLAGLPREGRGTEGERHHQCRKHAEHDDPSDPRPHRQLASPARDDHLVIALIVLGAVCFGHVFAR